MSRSLVLEGQRGTSLDQPEASANKRRKRRGCQHTLFLQSLDQPGGDSHASAYMLARWSVCLRTFSCDLTPFQQPAGETLA